MDGRRPRVGAGVPVGRADRRRRVHARSGRTTAPASGRRSSTSWRWCASGASATRACTSTTTPPTRRARCCGWPAATASARTTSTTCCATASSSTSIRWCARAFGSAPRATASSTLEPLYMGNELRSGEVTTATDSITQYARYCALRDDGRADDAAIVLKEIEDYNRYDCRSTRRLRDWLMARAIESRGAAARPAAGARRRRGRVEVADDRRAHADEVRRRRRRATAPRSRPPSR